MNEFLPTQRNDEMTGLLTVPQAAAYMGIPVRVLYRMIRDEIFPAVHMGRLVRVHRGQMTSFIESGGRKLSMQSTGSATHVEPVATATVSDGLQAAVG